MKTRDMVGLITLMVLWSAALHSQNDSSRFESAYAQLMNVAPDANRIASVNGIRLQREAGTFRLESGNIYLCTPIGQNDWICLFQGEGSFTYLPPNDLERGQIQRVFAMDTLFQEFNSLFLFMGDTTLRELSHHVQFGPGEIPRDVSKFLETTLKHQGTKEKLEAYPPILKTLLEENHNGLFFAQFQPKNGDPLVFAVNPFSDEEVSLYNCPRTSVWNRHLERISQSKAVRLTKTMAGQKHWFATERHILHCAFNEEFEFAAASTEIIRYQQDGHQWLCWYLFEDLIVDSVTHGNGTHLEFTKRKGNGLLWVGLPAATVRGTKDTIRLYYHGELIDNRNWISVKSSLGWYPHPYTGDDDFRRKAMFDVTFRVPHPYTIVSLGKQVSCAQTEQESITRWIPARALRNMGFSIGKFTQTRMADSGAPPVTVFATGRIDDTMDQEVAFDVSNSARFFSHVFGPCPVDSLAVAEIPHLHGEAFPGLLHLSLMTFLKQSKIDINASFRAHEVAHQWWGIAVDFDTYHDHWLSEGMAEFSGLWYMQLTLGRSKEYFQLLNTYRRRLVGTRKFLLVDGQPMGPIALGYRNESSTTRGDKTKILYEKGAWVVHMLRYLLMDLKTMTEPRFEALMREFYESFRGMRATTGDFKAIVEKHVGTEMTWFFDQWVNGTAIPTYEFTPTISLMKGPKYKVHLKVKQTNVPDSFRMAVPVTIDFGNDQIARVRVFVQGPITEIDLPLLSLKPEEIRFNDPPSVLCEMD